MYAKYLKTLTLAAGLTLLGSIPAAQAQYRSYDRYDRDQSYDQRYHFRQVTHDAREIQETAASISYQASRNNRRPDEAESEALDRLRDLSTQARRFQAETGRYGDDPQRTADEFQALADSFNATTDALRGISPRPYVERGMSRIAYLMDQMAPFYGQTADFRARLSDSYSSYRPY